MSGKADAEYAEASGHFSYIEKNNIKRQAHKAEYNRIGNLH